MCVSCVFTLAQGLQGLQKSLFAWFWVVLPPGPCAMIRWTFQNAVEHSCFDPSRFSMIDSLNLSGLVLPPKLEPRGNCVDALRFFSTFLEHIYVVLISCVYLFRKGGTYPLIGAAIKTQGWPISKQGQHLRSFSLVKLHSFCLRPTVLQLLQRLYHIWISLLEQSMFQSQAVSFDILCHFDVLVEHFSHICFSPFELDANKGALQRCAMWWWSASDSDSATRVGVYQGFDGYACLNSTFSMIKNWVGISLIELLIAIALMGGFHVASNEAPFERMLLHH